MQRAFNGVGQLTVEYQSHSGAVNTGTTPKVQYVYAEMLQGNNSRLKSMTYPNGKTYYFNYSTGLNYTISRLSSISENSDGTSPVESYDYLGLDAVVRRAHPSGDLTYIKQGSESTGDAGDQYTGLDRLGRIVDQRWITSGTATDRFKYGYDRDDNALWRDNLVNSGFGELFTFDSENRLTSFQRGTLNAQKTGLTGSASRSQSWTIGLSNNFSSVVTDGGTQTRTHDKQNEITSISGASTPVYDANGNTITDETGKRFVYDAWNRLVKIKDSGGTVLATYGYDALDRRITANSTNDVYFSTAWQALEKRISGAVNSQFVFSPVYADALVLRDRGFATLLNDTFTASDGTALTALGWTAGIGTFKVLSNQAVPNSGADNDQTVRDAGQADVVLTADVVPINSGSAERDPDLIVRWTDTTHHWVVHLTSAGDAIQLYEVNGGTPVLKASQSYTFNSGTSYAITVATIGATITVSVNGVQQFSYSSATSNQSATKVGLRLGAAGSASACSWDNIVVTGVERQWVQQDANWNVTALLGSSGSVVERYTYDPYGNFVINDSGWTVRSSSSYGWTNLHQGLRYDATATTYEDRNRWYDPDTMRFGQPDPIGFAGGDRNLYRPYGNRPTGAVDPSGLDFLDGLVEGLLHGRYGRDPHVKGATQAIGGVCEALSGAALFPFTGGLSTVIILHGLDNTYTGTRVAITGEPEPTITSSVFGETVDDTLNYVAIIAGLSQIARVAGPLAARAGSANSIRAAARLDKYVAQVRETPPVSGQVGLPSAPRTFFVEQGRDALGQFLPKNPGELRPGSLAERATFDAVLRKPGWNVIDRQVHVRDASGQLRVYDGVAISPRGRVIGLETKSGTGRLRPAQRAFDTRLNSNRVNTAQGVGQSQGITVERAIEVRR